MFIHVINAEYRGDYKVWVAFNDGAAGEIDLSPELYGEIFEPLKDKQFFGSFYWRAIPCLGAMAQTSLQSF